MLGSSAVPPTFPAVRIDGEAYWDGGIYSNTPVEAVFDDYPRRSSVVFAVQIWHSRGVEPESVAQVFARQKDIMFGSRSRSHIAAQARLHRLRHVVRTLFDLLPEDNRNTPEVQELADYGCATLLPASYSCHLSEWVPRRSRRKLKIADVVSEPESEPGPDWHHDHMLIAGRKCRHA